MVTYVATALPITDESPTTINDRGDIVGNFQGFSGAFDGFLYSQGTITEIRLPGSVGGSTASVGVTCGSLGYDTAADVLRDADLAMYAAKANSKAQVAVFEPQMHLRAVARLNIESELRQALSRDEFIKQTSRLLV